jgi:hypothetical protein
MIANDIVTYVKYFYVHIFVAGVEYLCGAITFAMNIQKGKN